MKSLGRGTYSDALDNDRDESERGDIVSGQAVVSCGQASPVLETAEEAFDKVATPIDGAIERARNCSCCGGWNNSLDATGFEPVTQAVRVISFICDQVFRRRDGTQQRHGHANVGNVARRPVYDPEIPADIYEIGLIYRIDIADDRTVNVDMSLTSPNCPSAQELPVMVLNAVSTVPGVGKVDVSVVCDQARNASAPQGSPSTRAAWCNHASRAAATSITLRCSEGSTSRIRHGRCVA